MNEETSKLIQQLADKLGTTAEHLWSVLIRQAPISGIIGLLCDASLVLLIIMAWKKLTKINFDKWDDDVGKGILYAGLVIATAIAAVSAFGSFPTEVAGLLNPEYWAFKQIIK